MSGDAVQRYLFHAGGAWHEPADGQFFESDDPYRGQPWALIPRCQAADVDRAVQAAHAAFTEGPWPAMSPSERGEAVRRLGAAVARHAPRLAAVETRDNGKRNVDIEPGLRVGFPEHFAYYGGLADKIEGSVIPTGQPGMLNYTRAEPYGVVAAITAWNSPLLIATWKLAPALAAGNTVVLKPSELASASTLELMAVFEEADLPPGVINVVTGYGHEAGQALVAHPLVRKVSFTGSLEGGRRVAALAAEQVKSVTLELGGKSPQIVFDDAPLEDAVNGVVGGLFPPTGHSCIAGSRLLAQAGIHDGFVERVAARARDGRFGPPGDAATTLGPIANRAQYERILAAIARGKAEGATCILGGGPAPHPEGGQGWFIEPTIFTGVTPDMALAREEIFGPVLAVLRFETEAEAVAIANDTVFGLAAGIWSDDYRRAVALADRLQAGTVYINNYFNACPMSPVGGMKQSGYGRENGWEGIKDFQQTKSVWMGTARGLDNPFPRGD